MRASSRALAPFSLALVLLAAAPAVARMKRFQDSEKIAPGLTFHVTLIQTGAEKTSASKALRQAFAESRKIYAQIDAENEQGQVALLNRTAGQKRSVRLSPSFLRLLKVCSQIYDWTGGLFDVVKSASRRTRPVLDVDFETGLTSLPNARTWLDLSEIGRGYLTDRLLGTIRALGYENILVKTGASLRAIGRDGNESWRLTIPDPQQPDGSMLCRLSVDSAGIATADARAPKGELESVTVLATNATTAEALAATALRLKKSKALGMFSKLTGRGISAILQDVHGKVQTVGSVTAACLE